MRVHRTSAHVNLVPLVSVLRLLARRIEVLTVAQIFCQPVALVSLAPCSPCPRLELARKMEDGYPAA